MLPDDLSIACVNYNMPFSTAQLTEETSRAHAGGDTGFFDSNWGGLHRARHFTLIPKALSARIA